MFLNNRFKPILLAVLASICDLQSKTAGVYAPTSRWTSSHTVATFDFAGPVTLKMCWEQPDRYVHKDNLSYPEREVVFQFGEVKKKIQEAVENGWKKYANIDFDWSNAVVGASCDIKIYIDHRINDGEDVTHQMGHYTGIGVLSATRMIRLEMLYFEPEQIYDYKNPSTTYTTWTRPTVSRNTYEAISKARTTPQARKDLAQRIANRVMVHEVGHVLGIFHEQCYNPSSYGNAAGCASEYESIMQPIGAYDPYSIMLYGGYKAVNNDPEPSCGDIIAVRALYGVKEVPGDRKNHCRVGTNICRTVTPMPKTADDPIPTDIPGGSCSMTDVDESLVSSLPGEQISKTNITTYQNTTVNVEKTLNGYSNPPEPGLVPIGNSCKDRNWIAPSQDASLPLRKVHAGENLDVEISFLAAKDFTYTLYAVGGVLGRTAYTSIPMIPMRQEKSNSDGWTTWKIKYPVPEMICSQGMNQACTPDKNWYLGFMLNDARTYTGGPLPPITIGNNCQTTRSVWVSEKIKTKVIVQEVQTVARTAEARFAILNTSAPDAGPGQPDAFPGESHPLAWVHSDQVVSQSFDLLLYPAKETAKESPQATWPIATYKKGSGTNTVWVNFPESFTNASGAEVKVKGWARIKGVGTISSTSKLTAYSPPFYIGPPPPKLDKLEPGFGDPGDIVTISGRFVNAQSLPVSATFRGEPVEIVEKTESAIRFHVPSTRRSGSVQVTLDGVPSNQLNFQIKPRIESVHPEHPVAGEVTEIRGYGFTEYGLNPIVTLNGDYAMMLEATEGVLKVSLSKSALYRPGNLAVAVGAVTATSFVIPKPIITSVSSDAGVPGQGVYISGYGFGTGTVVTLNGAVVPSAVLSSTSEYFVVQTASTSGELKVTVPAAQGQTSATSNSIHFTVGPKPYFISNDYGMPGTGVRIGGYFGTPTSNRAVFLSETMCWILDGSPSEITFGVPPYPSFPSGMVSVQVDGIRKDFAPFTVLPILTGLSQNYAEPGETIRLRGAFSENTVNIVPSSGSITVLGKGSESFGHEYLEFRVNEEFSSLNLSVSVNRYKGSGTIPLGTWVLRARPVIAAIEPAYGLPGDNITLKGKHFTHGGSAPVVRFDGVAATVVSYSDESLVVTVPPGSGEPMVTVTRAEGGEQHPSFALPFRYTPVVGTWKPNIAVQGGLLEVSAQNLSVSGNDLVYVGNALATIVSRSPTSLKVRVNPKAVTGEIYIVSDGVTSAKKTLKVVPNLVPIISQLLD